MRASEPSDTFHAYFGIQEASESGIHDSDSLPKMENLAEYGTARHGIETYKYRLCNQFDQLGLPKQFQDCAYILKLFRFLASLEIVSKSPRLSKRMHSPSFWKRRMSSWKPRPEVAKRLRF